MPAIEETLHRLAQIPNLQVLEQVPLNRYTRFGIGGPADVYVETENEAGFIEALRVVRSSGLRYVVIGGGTNLVVADRGFAGVVLRFRAREISSQGQCILVQAGAELQALVDYAVTAGLKGTETMTGIPGSVGAAIYGNAGAYGHSIMERVAQVRFFDGERVRVFSNAECKFQYRESVFKRQKEWVIFAADLHMDAASAGELRRVADEILNTRNQKYPPAMKCAGSIFKNLIMSELPESVRRIVPAKVIREGKVPSAYFLEEVGAKGLRNGDIHVADYHANLIYNVGHGSAREVRELIDDLKGRVQRQFGMQLEEEVQYVGFEPEGTR
ncbi:MAG: UDP-N-acetylmuramate dehydrogenase, partial [Acidobacteriota bacterium]|nr:UDP-N-acetylmuramate dehydrogenase [Acidobacteriota bacterium]